MEGRSAFRRFGLAGQDGVSLTVKGIAPARLWELIQDLGTDLLNEAYAARALDVPATWALLADLAADQRPTGIGDPCPPGDPGTRTSVCS